MTSKPTPECDGCREMRNYLIGRMGLTLGATMAHVSITAGRRLKLIRLLIQEREKLRARIAELESRKP